MTAMVTITNVPKEGEGGGGRVSAVKNAAIVEAARELFLDQGFDSVSMDAIAERAGVSKRTVYSHFNDKQTLFGAVMRGACENVGLDMNTIDPDAPPEEVLTKLGVAFATLVTSPTALAIARVVLTESPRHPELARMFYDNGCISFSERLAGYLDRQVALGRLKVDDTTSAALEFYELAKSPLHFQLMLGLIEQPTADEIQASVERKVAIFIRMYRP